MAASPRIFLALARGATVAVALGFLGVYVWHADGKRQTGPRPSATTATPPVILHGSKSLGIEGGHLKESPTTPPPNLEFSSTLLPIHADDALRNQPARLLPPRIVQGPPLPAPVLFLSRPPPVLSGSKSSSSPVVEASDMMTLLGLPFTRLSAAGEAAPPPVLMGGSKSGVIYVLPAPSPPASSPVAKP